MDKSSDALWRVGRKLGRTIYFENRVCGMVDNREIANLVVHALNATGVGNKDLDRDVHHATQHSHFHVPVCGYVETNAVLVVCACGNYRQGNRPHGWEKP